MSYLLSPAPNAAPPMVASLIARWHRVECWLATMAFGLVAALTVYDVVSRQVFGPLLGALGFHPSALNIQGTQKMAVYAMIVGAFCGIGIATAAGAQMVPKVAFGMFPKSMSPLVDRLADLITVAVLLAVAWYGWQFVASSKAAGMLSSGGIDIQAWIIQTIIPLGFLSATVRYACFAVWPALRPMQSEIQE